MATAPKISNLPAAPNRQQPANFSAKGDALLSSLQGFATEANDLGDYVEGAAGQVAIDKAAVDANVPLLNNAKAAAPLALSYRDTAKAYRDAAAASEAKALQHKNDAASFVVYQNLASFALSKNITAIAVYVDVSPNPELSVQKRTSWFARFGPLPDRKLIIASETKVYLFDGDDPTAPVWAEFEQGIESLHNWDSPVSLIGSNAYPISCVRMLNGVLTVGSARPQGEASASPYGLFKLDFGADKVMVHAYTNVGGLYAATRVWEGGIGQAGENHVFRLVSDVGLRSGLVRGVDMFVHPNAPTNPISGMKIPTIAVATATGVAVIHPDNTYTHSKYTDGIRSVSFDDNGGLYYGRDTHTAYLHFAPADGLSKEGFGDGVSVGSPHSALTPLLGGGSSRNQISAHKGSVAVAGNAYSGYSRKGLMIYTPDPRSPNKGLTTFLDADYNTGVMADKCLGAWLCSTDPSTLAGGPAINPDMTSAGWAPNGGNYVSHTANSVKVNETGQSGVLITNALVIGRAYRLRVSSGASSTAQLEIRNSSSGTDGLLAHMNAGNVREVDFVAKTTNIYVRLPTGGTAVLDTFEIAHGDHDRTHYDRGVEVIGTVTREPVAEGAELMGYNIREGSALIAPRITDFDNIGTGDMSVTLWYYNKGVRSTSYLFKLPFDDGGGSEFALVRRTSSGNMTLLSHVGTTVGPDSRVPMPKGEWVQLALVRKDGFAQIYVNGEPDGDARASGQTISTTSRFIIGAGNVTGGESCDGLLALYKPYARGLSPEEVRAKYLAEKPMFRPHSKVTLHGTINGVHSTMFDKATGLLYASTNQGIDELSGIVRTGHTGTASRELFAANDGTVLEQ